MFLGRVGNQLTSIAQRLDPIEVGAGGGVVGIDGQSFLQLLHRVRKFAFLLEDERQSKAELLAIRLAPHRLAYRPLRLGAP